MLIDGRFEATPAALRLVGDALGVSERGEELARYTEALFEEIDAALAEIPPDRRPRVYMARGPDGLETGLKGSINTEIIERAGGRNVADPGDADVRRGIVNVSMEQVLAANPDTIITWTAPFTNGYGAIRCGRASRRCGVAGCTCPRCCRSGGSTGRPRSTG